MIWELELNCLSTGIQQKNDDIIKIEAESGENTKVIVIDTNDGMSVVTRFADGKVIGVKYLNNKDDFEYIGKPSELYF